MESPITKKISVRDLLHIVFKRRIPMLLFFSVTVCTVVIVTLIEKPKYEATSQILVKVGREDVYTPADESLRPVVSANREEQIFGEIEILKSRSLADKVIASMGLRAIYGQRESVDDEDALSVEEAADILQSAVEVGRIEKSNVIEVSYQHTDAEMAATVVNRLVNLYLDHHLEVHKNPYSHGFFEDQIRILKNELRGSEQGLRAFKEKHQITSLGEERSLLLRLEADLKVAGNETLSQEVGTRNRISQIQELLASMPKTVSQGEDVEHNPLIGILDARLVELEIEEKELLAKYTEESRLVRNVRDEIGIVREKLVEQEAKRYGRSRSGLNTTYQRLEEELFHNLAEVKALKARKEVQTAQLADYHGRVEKLNRIEAELNKLQHEVDVDRKNYALYLTKFEESRISDAMDAEKIANVRVIEPAHTPLRPVSPNVTLNILLAVFLGGFGGLGLAFFLEYLDDALERSDDVEHVLGLPVLASIPEFMSSSPGSPQGGVAPRASSSPRFALAGSVLVAGCIIFAVGHYLRDSQLKTEGEESLAGPNVFRAKIIRQTNVIGRAVTESLQKVSVHDELGVKVALASVPDQDHMEKKNNVQEASGEQNSGLRGASIRQIELEREEATKEFEPPLEESRETLNTMAVMPKPMPKKADKGNLMIQVGAFRERARAEDLVHGLRGKGYDVHLEKRPGGRLGPLFLVRLQGYSSPDEAKKVIDGLRAEGLHSSFIIKGERAISRTGPKLKAEAPKAGIMVIQVGAFGEKARAEVMVKMLQGEGYDAYFDTRAHERMGPLYQVRLRGYATRDEVKIAIAQLEQQGFNKCFVTDLGQN
ncbi:MAG: SPOR domain-containing protein [Pseudomonadota bacterium]